MCAARARLLATPRNGTAQIGGDPGGTVASHTLKIGRPRRTPFAMLPILFAALVVADGPTPATPAAEPAAALTEHPGGAPPVDGAITVAVLDLKATAGNEGAARALTTLITNEIGSRKGWRAVSRNEVKALLAHQADQRLVGCEETQCIAD